MSGQADKMKRQANQNGFTYVQSAFKSMDTAQDGAYEVKCKKINNSALKGVMSTNKPLDQLFKNI